MKFLASLEITDSMALRPRPLDVEILLLDAYNATAHVG